MATKRFGLTPKATSDRTESVRLRLFARQSGNGDQLRCVLALAAIYNAASRAEAAGMGVVTRQIVRDWVERFNAGGPDALITRKAPGKPPLLTLAQAIENGPAPGIDGVVRWRRAEISARVAPGRDAALVVDQARWHLSAELVMPATITVVPLPAKCQELNTQENVWQFMRDNWLSNRVFPSADNIGNHCCSAWNKLVEQPWTIMSIGQRDWAQGC